ncbi:MAG TPA: Mur ligase domain-containing protein, partial [Hyphomicrobiaceae bacterium]|nr:Mur ligase domain-containing protein [Hyphomicrobiaceae bacterium]
MKLHLLLAPGIAAPPACGEVEIAGLTSDSRVVQPGWLFAGLGGTQHDGAAFIPEALAKGAAALLVKTTAEVKVAAEVPILRADEPRRALALMAARMYAPQPATAVAVTGTSGKTSVASFTRQIWSALGKAAASVGTIGVTSPKGDIKGSLTTPDPIALHAM